MGCPCPQLQSPIWVSGVPQTPGPPLIGLAVTCPLCPSPRFLSLCSNLKENRASSSYGDHPRSTSCIAPFIIFFSEEKSRHRLDQHGFGSSHQRGWGQGQGEAVPAQGSGETTTSQRPHPGNRRKEELHQDLGLGLSFPARRRLLLLWVCSGKVVPGFWGRAGVVASLLH